MSGVVTLGTVRYTLVKNGGKVQVLTGGAKGDTGASGPVAGADKQVVFNDAGAAAGNANFTWDKTTNTLTVSRLSVGNGAATTPSVSNGSTGFYFSGANGDMYVTTGGTYRGGWVSGRWSIASGFVLGWESGASATAPDVVLARGGAGILEQRNGANAQTFRLANNYTDGSNNEFAGVFWASNYAHVKTTAVGTGTLRALLVGAAVPVSRLPAAAAGLVGARSSVSDATVAYSAANIGTTVAGGGSNVVPVFCTGSAWIIA